VRDRGRKGKGEDIVGRIRSSDRPSESASGRWRGEGRVGEREIHA